MLCVYVCVCVGMPAHLYRPGMDPITDNSWNHENCKFVLRFNPEFIAFIQS